MAILDIIEYPDPRLKIVAGPVAEVTDQTRQQLDDMVETMYHDQGGGLAATQVNIPLRMFVMDASHNKSGLMHFINPEIIEHDGEIEEVEGCLSFPGVSAVVKRWRYVKVRALNYAGEPFELTFDGNYEARCVQHELDHLNGITFFDHLKPLKRQMMEKKLQKYLKARL